MARQYKWETKAEIISGGYEGEGVGVDGSPQEGTTENIFGNATATYYYHDSPNSSDSNSTKVKVTVTDSWTAQFDKKNNLKVTVSTSIGKIERADSSWSGEAATYHIQIRRSKGNKIEYDVLDQGNSNHIVLAHPHHMSYWTFTIPPGGTNSASSLYYRNSYKGHENDKLPTNYADVMAMGVKFTNLAPKDYRPGDRKIGTWKSHNREVGKAQRKGYAELRSSDGGEASDNPPSIKKDDTWLNQKKIGEES